MDYHLCLNRNGYILGKNQLDTKTIEKIKKELTVSPIVLKGYQDFVKPVEFEIFQESPNYLYIPRFYGLEKFGIPHKTYLPEGQSTNLTFIYDLKPHQVIPYEKTIQTLKATGGGVLQLPCGQGKCLSFGTKILMFNGEIKRVENIVVGDQLMGDDSTPRNVLSLATGRDQMYEITPMNGEPWGCNQAHILSLKCSINHDHQFTKGSIHDIELRKFLQFSKNSDGQETPLRLYKVPIIFPPKAVELDAYLMGYWLGNNTTNKTKIAIVNSDVIDYFRQYLQPYGLSLKQTRTINSHKGYCQYKITNGIHNPKTLQRSINNSQTNYFHQCLDKYNVISHKHIPHDYKCNSRDIQLKVLAGLIDSNGSFSNNYYEIVLISEILIDDIVFVCRSLGFSAYKKIIQQTCTNSQFGQAIRRNLIDQSDRISGICYQCIIFGNGLEQIPVLIQSKKAFPQHQINDSLMIDFSVKSKGLGNYYGFTIDGNHRFLLGDFTVTHNTAIAIKVAVTLQHKTLVVVNKECLMDQWSESIVKFTGGKASVGCLQQDRIDVKDKDFIIAMLHSVAKKDYPKDLFNDISLTIIDEVHHIASEMFSKALPKIASKYMLGLSATPIRKDGLSHVFHKYIGPLHHSEKRQGSNRVLIKRFKLTSSSNLYETLYMKNGTKNNVAMITNVASYDVRTILLIECIRILMQEERKILLLSGRIDQLETIYEKLTSEHITTVGGREITFGYYYGNQGGSKKKHLQMLHESAKCDVVLGTYAIASEGMDLPDLNTEIMATPITDVEQSVGRILRKFHDKVNPMVIDLVDSCGNFPRQAAVRAKFYKEEDYEIQNLKIPLGLHPGELKPFLSEIHEYLLDTHFKQSRFERSQTDIDDVDDDSQKKIGHCVFDDGKETKLISNTSTHSNISGLNKLQSKPKIKLMIKKT